MQQVIIFLTIVFLGVYFSIKLRKLTVPAAMIGAMIACCIFIGAGFTGLSMLATFFVVGTFATRFKIKTKESFGAAEKDHGRRTSGQVIANAGIAALTGLTAWMLPGDAGIFRLMMAACFASATADTLSSELGTLYGRRFFNITDLRPGLRGDNGVISLEGSLIGIAGATFIAVIYCIGLGWSNQFYWIVLAGTIGNIADSLLGATLERRGSIGNNVVNLLNTLIAAVFALFLYWSVN